MTRFSRTRETPRHAGLHAIADAIPHMVWVADSSGLVEYVNRQGCAYIGISPAGSYEWDWLSLVHPEDCAHARRIWTTAVDADVVVELECRMGRADGQFRWHSITTLPLNDTDGRFGTWIGTATDIHEQKRLEGQLHRADRASDSQRRRADELRSVVMANMAEGLYTTDAEGRFTFLNAAAERMLGWTVEDLHGKPAHDTIHFQRPDGSPLADEPELREARREGRAVHVTDDAFTRKDGSTFSVAYSATPLANPAGAGGMVIVFRDTTDEKAEREQVKRQLDALTWVGRTRDALDDGRIVLYSQPIVPLTDGDPREELLLRMVGRKGEIIRPGVFLPAAEKYGLIGEIDQRVGIQAARLAATGRFVQANLSALSISSPDLLSQIEHALSHAGANPANLVFEITETALMQDVEAGERFARGVAAMGCGLALDDFGTGYGSFSRLKRLPVKYLKIDMEFVRHLGSSSGNRHVIAAIVGLAKGFGQRTIAEGVEDGATLELLREGGVDFAQGYHLGRPVPLGGAEGRPA